MGCSTTSMVYLKDFFYFFSYPWQQEKKHHGIAKNKLQLFFCSDILTYFQLDRSHSFLHKNMFQHVGNTRIQINIYLKLFKRIRSGINDQFRVQLDSRRTFTFAMFSSTELNFNIIFVLKFLVVAD